MGKYIIHENTGDTFHAGSKATADCESILLKEGFQILSVSSYEDSPKFIRKIRKQLQLLKFLKIEKGAEIVVPHPMYIGKRYMKMLQYIKRKKNVKLIFIIHDLESLRGLFQDFTEFFQNLDDAMFEVGNVLIVHNQKMKEYLMKERSVKEEKIVVLQLFDYLVKEEWESKHERRKTDGIAIAGNLLPGKSGYIYKLREAKFNEKVKLYGVNYEEGTTEVSNWEYQGAFPPDVLPFKMEAAYGLVWDGGEISECSGNTGNYLRYNNPHKVSLYIAAGLPIIIWKQAALAGFIEENKIGFAINSLEEMEKVISNVTDAEYEAMINNMKNITEKVRAGRFIEEAYYQSLKVLKEREM